MANAPPLEKDGPASVAAESGAGAVGSGSHNREQNSKGGHGPESGNARGWAELRGDARWVVWRSVQRGGKATKVPFCPEDPRRAASVSDFATWGPHATAEAAHASQPGGGGVGIVLGGLDGPLAGWSLGGVDLDTCRDPATGAVEGWALDVLRLLGAHAELSPSGTGLKAFFLYETDTFRIFKGRLVADGGGKAFKRGSGEHPPAIEVYLAGRWFAVTGQHFEGTPADVQPVRHDALRRLLAEVGPNFAGERATSAVPRTIIPMGDRDGTLWPRIMDAADKDRHLHGILHETRLSGRDTSRSAVAFRLGAALVRHGFTFEEMREAIGSFPPTEEWCRRKGEANAGRELKRIWDKASATRAARPAWFIGIDLRPNGEVLPSQKNVIHALRSAEELAGLFALDQFSGFPEVTRRPPWDERDEGDTPRRLRDTDLTHVRVWLETHGIPASLETVQAGISAVAEEHGFHPVREYLNGLTWDRVPRLDGMLHTFFRAEDNELNRAFGRRFLIGAIARVMQPGAKMDTALILEGPQGIGKSSAVRVLASDAWFTDQLPEMGTKDAGLQVQGRWMIELGELTNVTRAEAGQVKQFLSTSVDRFRAPYARSAQDHPRQCVFVGTINPNGRGYLKDETGNRRFWIVQCHAKLDLDGLRAARDQLWAEAVYRFQAGEPWWLDSDALEEQQAAVAQERRDTDPMLDRVREHVETLAYAEKDALLRLLTTTYTHRSGDDGPTEHTRPPNRADEMRLGVIMQDLGWAVERRMTGGARQRLYVRTDKAEPMVEGTPGAIGGEADDAF